MELRFHTDMSGVLDLVHDRWFELAQVKFDRQKGEVTVPLGEKRKGPFADKILKITGVSNITIMDDAKIGIYDLCDLIPDYSSSSIRITSGFPIEIILEIKQKGSIRVLTAHE
ncbi:hypothetical protein W02_11570 [Nitrospira sp. KM1]|nr:hypothetical protein W02_11570 [Nitrospira sp. KM1]